VTAQRNPFSKMPRDQIAALGRPNRGDSAKSKNAKFLLAIFETLLASLRFSQGFMRVSHPGMHLHDLAALWRLVGNESWSL
jgi:hypothetical protein